VTEVNATRVRVNAPGRVASNQSPLRENMSTSDSNNTAPDDKEARAAAWRAMRESVAPPKPAPEPPPPPKTRRLRTGLTRARKIVKAAL
jgi:hypothetical protein